MQGRLAGSGKRTPAPVIEQTPPRPRPRATTILGIDPSLRGTGYGVISTARHQLHCLAHGTVKCHASWPRSRCFVQIAQELKEILKQYQPTVCAIEALFYAQNLQTALIMGEARGVAILTAAEAGLDIYEIAPRKVKQAIVGYGAARKEAVGKMVQRMLDLPCPPAPDAADALALALAHAHDRQRHQLTLPRKL